MTEAGSVYGLAMYELAASEGLAEEILCAAAGVMLGVLVIFTAGYIKRKRSNR